MANDKFCKESVVVLSVSSGSFCNWLNNVEISLRTVSESLTGDFGCNPGGQGWDEAAEILEVKDDNLEDTWYNSVPCNEEIKININLFGPKICIKSGFCNEPIIANIVTNIPD